MDCTITSTSTFIHVELDPQNQSNTQNIKTNGELFRYSKSCVKYVIHYMRGKSKGKRNLNKTSHTQECCLSYHKPIQITPIQLYKSKINVNEVIQNRKIQLDNYNNTDEYFTEIKKSEQFKEWLKMVKEEEFRNK